MTEQTIPVIDLNDFTSGQEADRKRFVKTLGEALVDLGFFAVTNHGVDPTLIKRAYSLSESFFSLQEERKLAYEFEELRGQRGFVSFGREHAKGVDAPDLKEFWHVGRELAQGHELESVYGHNIWPSHEDAPEDFKTVFLELYRQLEVCSKTLLRACALFLGEAEDFLADMTIDGDTILRIIHYPPLADEREPDSIRAAAHEDINLITLLCESTDAGLELLQRDGQWRPIHALEGQIIADCGDMLQNLTNGLLKSTTHRVVNPDNDRSRRFSMPFFVHPRAEVDLSPLPSCISKNPDGGEFQTITAREFLLQRLREIGLTT
ncbi:MAG: 2-oxoglutarate and iron-dependent oxygenase domain-containing protein, partial [Myxococcota bacterium]|nr:2-oxoglutarate and iron-dependent oxygenase domain-containing protein [Myxococcota bacterium]